MHVSEGVVTGAKIILSWGTATGAGLGALWMAREALREAGIGAFAARVVAATVLVFGFFEVLPHYPVGVSEVHLILGSTLMLLFGAGPAAIGLAAGLLIQGLFFAPFDLPQYGMNVTTLILPLMAISALARRIIPARTAYVDLEYRQVLALSLSYQGGIVAWVGFWAIYGGGFSAANLTAVATFGGAYMLVVLLEPLVDLAVLKGAKALRGDAFLAPRLRHPAV